MSRQCTTIFVAVCLAAPAAAEAVRFHYARADACGAMVQVPIAPGAIGERLNGFGFSPRPFNETFRPNQIVTFRHPFTGRNVTIPLTLPVSTPRIEHQSDAVIFNYGSYTATVRFFADGSADVTYNSGFLRPLVVQ